MTTFLVDVKSNFARYLDDPLCVVIPCRHLRQVEFVEHIDARERCQHLAFFFFFFSDKVSTFVGKLDLWRNWLINTIFDMFPNFADCVQDPFSCPGKDISVDKEEQLVR